ncbi:hypothetical protein ACO1O0_002974 [Amphichorda felina]
MSHLSAGNGISVELFEFQEPRIGPGARAEFARDYERGGYFHMAVMAPDVEALCERAVAVSTRKVRATIPMFEYEAIYNPRKPKGATCLLPQTSEDPMSAPVLVSPSYGEPHDPTDKAGSAPPVVSATWIVDVFETLRGGGRLSELTTKKQGPSVDLSACSSVARRGPRTLLRRAEKG